MSDGQQVYSHDAAFNSVGSDSIKNLFAYQLPSLPMGTVMTDAMVGTMPQAFIYRRLADGSCAITLNTYLGRDYMGATGRFGNHLSHVVICNESHLSIYPCELYGGDVLLNKAPDGVKSADKPNFLPEPSIVEGGIITPESISDFLSDENRIEHFKKMIAAMLMHKKAKKRLVICDSPDNILRWVAALHYTLPIKLALNINFSTYEYDPSLSASQICGVMPQGTKHNTSNAHAHFTFDFYSNNFPDIDVEGDFFDFIDMGMTLSFDGVKDFHHYINEALTYSNADEDYYDVYSLFSLATEGLENLSLDAFRSGVRIANIYAVDSSQSMLLESILKDKDLIFSLDDEYQKEIFYFVIKHMNSVDNDTQEQAKVLLAKKVISHFFDSAVREKEFMQIYSDMENLCSYKRISMPCIFMETFQEDENKHFVYLKKQDVEWRWNFIAKTFFEYIVHKGINIDALTYDCDEGKFIGDFIILRISQDRKRGFVLITNILNKLSSSWRDLIDMAYNIEGYMIENPKNKGIISATWLRVLSTAAKVHGMRRKEITSYLMQDNRYEQVVGFFKELLANTNDAGRARMVLDEHLKQEDKKYINKYIDEIIELYYQFLTSNGALDDMSSKKDFLELLVENDLLPPFINNIAESVLEDISFASLSSEDKKFIMLLADHYLAHNNFSWPNRLLLFVSAIQINKEKHDGGVRATVDKIRLLTDGRRVKLGQLSDIALERYIKWVCAGALRICRSHTELISCYSLFEHTDKSSEIFIMHCANEAIGDFQKNKTTMIMFLELLFSVGSEGELSDVGDMFSRLGKDLKRIDELVLERFEDEKSHLQKWNKIFKHQKKPSEKKGWLW